MQEIITKEMSQVKLMIAETVVKRNSLKLEMEDWYSRFPGKKFPKLTDLSLIDGVLSELDSHYKRLWDFNNTQKKSA